MIDKRIITKLIAEGVSLVPPFIKSQAGLRIINYHSIGGRAFEDERGMFSLSELQFKEHIKLMTERMGCEIVPLQPLCISQNLLQVAITFDDGYLNNLRIAAPILVEKNIPFAVFVSSDFVANRTDGFLRPEELRELSRLPGVSIGAHGKSHRSLIDCDDQTLRAELLDSKCYLEDVLGYPVTAISYPFGAANRRVRQMAEQLGYELGVCTRFDINAPCRDPLMLCRYNIESDNTIRVLRQKLLGDWDWYRWRSPDPLELEGIP